jgi:LuxR family transcriptional regulator, maltose regulon positive regulatory protein
MGQQLDPAPTVEQEPLGAVPAATGPGLSRTKLSRPRLPPGYLHRPQVDALLDAGTRGPLTLVSAGAGWGKTLGTAAWASGSPRVGPVGWVSLDARDNEPRAFWSYVVEALRSTALVAPDSPLAQLVPGLGSDEENLRRLVAGLERLPGPVVLVLDDFDVVDDPTVLAGLTQLLRVPVPQLRLVLLTRADPTLPLHRLRVAGQLTQIRSADLALTASDATALVAVDGVALSGGDAELLVHRTEGWPAGLRLAAMFLARDEPGHAASDFGGDDHAVVEYLAEEVLARHPVDVRRFLLRTSVAERLDASLAEALTGEVHSQQHLEDLAASNSFVVELGPGRRWYRYHALLRQMLRHRLSVEAPEVVPDLHRRAAAWFGEHGRPVDAMHHAADAHDWALLGRLLVTHALPLALSAERPALAQVLARVPSHHLADTPGLGLVAATRVLFAADYAELGPHLAKVGEQVGPEVTPEATATRIALNLFGAALCRATGDNGGAIESATRALALLSGPGSTLPAAGGYRVTALANLGTGLLWSGRLGEAERRLRAGLGEAEGTVDASRVNMFAHLALSAAVAGRLVDAERLASQGIQLAQDRGWSPLVQEATAHLALSMVHLQRNDLDEAAAALAAGRGSAVLEPAPRLASALVQVRVDAASGRVDTARRGLARLHRELGAWVPPRLLARWLRVTEAEVELADGIPAAALARVPLDGPDDADETLVPERLLRARAMLDLADPAGAEAALAPLHEAGLEHLSEVELWVLTALVADRLRQDRRATDALRRALGAAGPEGIRRPFVAWGQPRLPGLLARVKVLHPAVRAFVQELEGDDLATTAGSTSVAAQAVALTERELSVLQYLPSMMTYPEIAAQLFVSVNTVKSHLRHLYAKLEVVNRRQAVIRAREIGLLES